MRRVQERIPDGLARSRTRLRVCAGGALISALGALLFAQASTRLATTPEALVAAPIFFHGKQIVVRRDVEPAGSLMRLASTPHPVVAFCSPSPGPPRARK